MAAEIGETGKLFDLNEAKALLPLIRSVTDAHRERLAPVQDRLSKMLSNDPRRGKIEQEFEHIVSRWKEKVEQLGASVQGLWVVEFDVGEGYLSWRYPEMGLNFFRPEGSKFADRIRLSRYVEETDPDWAEY